LFSGCGISLAKQVAQRRIVGGDDAGFGNLDKHSFRAINSVVVFHYTEKKLLSNFR
jgi:hypothetical protein